MKKKDQGTKAANTNKIKAATKTKQPENIPGTDQVLEELAEELPVVEHRVTEEINQELEDTAEKAAEASKPVDNSTDNTPADKPANEVAKTSKKEPKENPFHKIAKGVFANHKEEISTLYFTQDGTPFIHIQHARMHADSLADHLITTITRLEVK